MPNNNISILKEALERRHSHYSLAPEWVSPKTEVENLLADVLNLVPSHFNSQTVRIVLVTENKHKEHWQIIENALIEAIGEERYNKQTKDKIHSAFMSGIGTILFFDDTKVTEGLQNNLPAYASYFPQWATQVQGSHQFATWIGLTELGFGASLQHYLGLADDKIKEHINAPKEWNFIGHMPFGKPTSTPEKKEKRPISELLKVF